MIGATNSFCTQLWPDTLVKVESDIMPGYFQIQVVGLGDSSIRECRERIRSAIQNSGFLFPMRHIVINLSPNDQKKSGSIMELAMATSVLIASGQLSQSQFKQTILLGSLSLNGDLVECTGIQAGLLMAARQKIIRNAIIPWSINKNSFSLPGLDVYPVKNLAELRNFLKSSLATAPLINYQNTISKSEIDFSEIEGLGNCKTAIACALTGGHHALMIGSPGTGKSLVAKASRSLLPALKLEESFEIAEVHSLNQRTAEFPSERPFRSPHHTTSDIALIGGGSIPRPGEVSLAHQGVLFLDELLEFKSSALQALREPLQDKKISISRAAGKVQFPANFTLLAASNPCRCGYLWHKERVCHCTTRMVQNLHQKIIGPLLDRIAFTVESDDNSVHIGWTSAQWRERINLARNKSLKRNQGSLNGELNWSELERSWAGPGTLRSTLERKTRALQLSLRSQILTAQAMLTLSDFQGKDSLQGKDIDEILRFRLIHLLLKQQIPA
jgi:magnesium chelatase family protein